MTALTPEAQVTLEAYLKRVRLSLRGTSVDAGEVERDVCEHIEQALSERQKPAARADLREVLERLGSPSQWVPEDEVPPWRRVLRQWQVGSEDWRLSYLCFGLVILGLVLAPLGGPILWIPAYFLGRAARALAAERGEPLGARRWLIYPPMVLFAATLTLLLLAGPFFPVAIWGIEESVFDRLVGGVQGELKPLIEGLANASLVSAAVGLWWIVLAPLSAWAIEPLRLLLAPLADRYQRRHAKWLALAGLAVVAVSASYLFLI